MALHRVASVESWERSSIDGSAGLLEPRRLSFNPIDNLILPGPSPPTKSSPAVEVSQRKRVVQIFAACLYCLFAAGLVFGFAAFKPVLVQEGVYSELCKSRKHDDGKTCVAQEIRLNLMFTTAAVATNVAALPVGTILDRYGPRVCGILGAAFLALGSGFMIVAPIAPFDCYLPGYVLLALGGPFVFISSFQLSNCFPQLSGLILALLTGAFDASSAIFLVYRLCYDASQGTFTPQKLFTVYLVIPAFVLAMQVFVMPAESYKTMGELIQENEDLHESTSLMVRSSDSSVSGERLEFGPSETTPLVTVKDHNEIQEQEERKKRISGVWGILHGLPAAKQIATPWWILIAVFTAFQMTRINYFVATIRTQYSFLLHSYKRAVQINNFFDVLLPVGGIISIPFIGLILDNLSTLVTLSILVVTATSIGILGILPYMWAAYLNVILFTLYRPFYYTAISDYTAKIFGFATFGKVYGLIICVSGLFNFTQAGLDALTHTTFQDDPVPVNVLLLSIVLIIGTTLVIYVQRQKHLVEHG